MDVSFERLIRNVGYELLENGIRVKIFGIPYLVNENDLDTAISFLMRLSERMKMIRKEKERLIENQKEQIPAQDHSSGKDNASTLP